MCPVYINFVSFLFLSFMSPYTLDLFVLSLSFYGAKRLNNHDDSHMHRKIQTCTQIYLDL